jgi:hypothetical protein
MIDGTRITRLGSLRPYRISKDAEQVVSRMNRYQWVLSTIAILAAGNFTMGCSPGGVGDPCIPEDEYQAKFAGYGVNEVNVEAMSFQCETRLCLVNHFQGRVTCPYGQTSVPDSSPPDFSAVADNLRCHVPDGKGDTLIAVDVDPQLMDRRAGSSVYCSCRCAGPDKTARYCKCPSGYACTLLNDIPLGTGSSQLLGSYCVRNGAAYVKSQVSTCAAEDPKCPANCNADLKNCPYEGYPADQNPFGKNAL